jgi:hypothetical protein
VSLAHYKQLKTNDFPEFKSGFWYEVIEQFSSAELNSELNPPRVARIARQFGMKRLPACVAGPPCEKMPQLPPGWGLFFVHHQPERYGRK